MFRPDVKAKIEEELARGESARSLGFEGRARVCARRAAGAAIRAYMEQRDLAIPGPSAMDLLAALPGLPGATDEMRQIGERLQTRVDEAFSLPQEIDLLADARRLAQILESMT